MRYYYDHRYVPEIGDFFKNNGFEKIDGPNDPRACDPGAIVFFHFDPAQLLSFNFQRSSTTQYVLMSTDPNTLFNVGLEYTNVHRCLYRADELHGTPRITEFIQLLRDHQISDSDWELLAPLKLSEALVAAYVLLLAKQQEVIQPGQLEPLESDQDIWCSAVEAARGTVAGLPENWREFWAMGGGQVLDVINEIKERLRSVVESQ